MKSAVLAFCLYVSMVFSNGAGDTLPLQCTQGCDCKGGMSLEKTRAYITNRQSQTSYKAGEPRYFSAPKTLRGALPDSVDSIHHLYVVCQSEIYEVIKQKVERYIDDIQGVYGCAVTLQTLSRGASVETLKDSIRAQYATHATDGVVLVGDLPVAFFFHEKYDQTFPSDYYLMELDGEWVVKEDESHTIFTENPTNWGIELFVGRISTVNCGLTDELAALKAYFDKNHAYWSGKTEVRKEGALSATDRDWASSQYFLDDIQYLYGSDKYEEYYYVYDPDDILNKNNAYNPTTYMEKICSGDYEFVQLACHSDEEQHHFYGYDYNDSEHHLNMETIRAAKPQALGYNLFCCYAGNWTDLREGVEGDTPGYLAASYIYNDSPRALTAVASTKSGGMLAFQKFYKPLGRGDAMGTAFKIWHNEQKAYYDKYSTLKQSGYIMWYYGLVLLGDPLISFHYDSKQVSVQSSALTQKYARYSLEQTQNSLTLRGVDGSVILLSLNGQVLRQQSVENGVAIVDLTGVRSGICLLQIHSGGTLHTKKVYIRN